MSMIEAKLHLLQVEHKVTPPDAIVPPQLRLRKAPEVLDPVNVSTVAMRKGLFMQDAIMPVALGQQPVVAPEPIGVNRAAPRDLLPNDPPQHRPGHVGDRAGVDLAAPLQEPQDDDFALHRSAPQMLADASKVTFVDFDFAMQPGLPFAGLHHGPANDGVDSLGRMAIDVDLPRRTGCRYLQRKETNQRAQTPGRQVRSEQQGRGHGSA